MNEKINKYQMCSRCIMDTKDDPDIVFDLQGICNHCGTYDRVAKERLSWGEQRASKLASLLEEVKASGRDNDYDCVVGASGGVDSTYVALLAKGFGLRALVVHCDNGWNSELAVKNIENIVKKLDFDLFTYVINWEEFKDLQMSYLKASVVDIEALTDHAITASLFQVAARHRIKYILSGENMVTEGVARELARIDLPLSMYTEWYWKIDLHNLFHFLSHQSELRDALRIDMFLVAKAHRFER